MTNNLSLKGNKHFATKRPINSTCKKRENGCSKPFYWKYKLIEKLFI